MNIQRFETRSVVMEQMLLLTFLAPADDVDRIMSKVIEITPLVMGSYDSNQYYYPWKSKNSLQFNFKNSFNSR